MSSQIDRRQFLKVAGAAGIGALAAGCIAPAAQQATEVGAPAVQIKQGGTFRWRHHAVPMDMDPLNLIGSDRMDFAARYLATPVNRSNTFEPVDYLCSSAWTDDTTLELEVHDKAKWHDGEPVTSEDIEFTIVSQTAPGSPSFLGSIWEREIQGAMEFRAGGADQISGIELLNDKKLRLKFNQVSPDFIVDVAWWWWILPKHHLADIPPKDWKTSDYATKPDKMIGCGPFRVVEFDRERRVVFEADPDHFLGRPYIDRIVHDVLEDAEAAGVAMLNGEFEFAGFTPPKLLPQFREQPDKFNIVSQRWPGTGGLQVNHAKEPLNDVRVRQALMWAIDREAYAKLQGFPFSGDRHWDYAWIPKPEGLTSYHPRDIEKAKSLLAEAGLPNGFELPILTGGTGQEDTSVLLQANLKEVGIEVRWDIKKGAAFDEDLFSGNYYVRGGGVNYASPSGAARYFDSREMGKGQAGANWTNFNNPEADKLIDAAASTTDPQKRAQAFQALELLLMNEVATIPIWRWIFDAPVSTKVHDFIWNGSGAYAASHLWRLE